MTGDGSGPAAAGGGPAAVLRVGVTGHRDLAEPVSVADAVDRVLVEVAGPARPLDVVSGLADGADRIVADRALARPGARLVAILPMPPEEYEADFGAGSREQFRRLLGRAARVEVTGPGPDGTRESAYERAGRRMVEECDVVLALWDGGGSRGRGGTAEIVAFAEGRGTRVVRVPVRRAGSEGDGPTVRPDGSDAR